MQAMDTQVYGGAFTGFDDFFFHLLAYFGYYFLDTCRVDTSVLYQLVQSQTGYFTTDRIKTGQHDCFRRIVNHDLNTGCCFQRPNVTPFTTDDTAFDLV